MHIHTPLTERPGVRTGNAAEGMYEDVTADSGALLLRMQVLQPRIFESQCHSLFHQLANDFAVSLLEGLVQCAQESCEICLI